LATFANRWLIVAFAHDADGIAVGLSAHVLRSLRGTR
jgi:hypothetical protein